MKVRNYTELSKLKTFDERFDYLVLDGTVGEELFTPYERWLLHQFYTSGEWHAIHDKVAIRDNGCDLGIKGCDISGSIYVHHMKPLTIDDLLNRTKYLTDPEYLISMSFKVHQAITYGLKYKDAGNNKPIVREANDTCPWRIK